MKSLTIGAKFRATSMAMFALTLVLGVTSVLSLHEVNAIMEKTSQSTVRKSELSGQADGLVSQMFSAQRGIVLASFMKERDRAEEQKRVFDQKLIKLQAVIAEAEPLLATAEGKRLVGVIRSDAEKWVPLYQEVVRLCESGNPAQAQALSFEKILPLYNELGDAAGQWLVLNDQLLAQDARTASSQYTHSFWIAIALLAVSFVVGVIIFIFTGHVSSQLRHIVSDLATSAEQVAAASGQIATTSQSLSQGSTEQASAVEEISTSMDKMSALATSVIGETAEQVGHSNTALGEMVGSMSSIKESSERVAKINKTIDEIAFQTNILALNAAVEAARAGEAGKGFAVVADEVRNLAQRAASAAKDTAALIEESIVNSNQGVLKVESVSEAIRGITKSSERIKELVGEQTGAMGQHSQGSIQQITTAIRQVSTVTQSNAAAAEESAAAAEELNAQSKAVRDLVNNLRRMVDRSRQNYQLRNASSFASARSARRAASSVRPAPVPHPAEEAFPMETVETGTFE